MEPKTIYDVGWSSPVARKAHNLEAVGSNPAPTTYRGVRLEFHQLPNWSKKL